MTNEDDYISNKIAPAKSEEISRKSFDFLQEGCLEFIVILKTNLLGPLIISYKGAMEMFLCIPHIFEQQHLHRFF